MFVNCNFILSKLFITSHFKSASVYHGSTYEYASLSSLLIKFLVHFQIINLHVIMSCDAATAEAAKTYLICKELIESKNKEVINFIKYVKYHRVYFTAASFFEIIRILSMVDIITNYLIVIVQLNGIYIK